MEKGSMRLEANISLAPISSNTLPTYKVELKNINSFRFLKSALSAEISRQEEILLSSKKVTQETRGFNEKTGKTFLQRMKEEAQDYRYFPEPDIPPIFVDPENILSLKNIMPELPQEKRDRFLDLYKLPKNYIDILVLNQSRSDFFESAVKLSSKHNITPLEIARVMLNLNMDQEYKEPARLVKKLVSIGEINYATEPETILAIRKVIASNPKAIKDFKSGSINVISFLIGQVQKELKGKGNPHQLRTHLIKYISNEET
jgi:aspartyl-tRNA(Asn)/glutamyl-tRNA(Gln) amidotransferase subunit B